MSRLLRIISDRLSLIEKNVDKLILEIFPPGPHPGLAVACVEVGPHQHTTTQNQTTLQDLLGDGFLWAVPKNRRSRERRMMRKFGSEIGHSKMLPVLKLLTCNNCGHVHEPGRLCPHCYSKVREVTLEMQQAMKDTQGLNPIEHDVFPLFQGEKVNMKDGFYEGQRVVEVDRKRPQWFSRRLTQQSNVTTSSDTTIANPTHLA